MPLPPVVRKLGWISFVTDAASEMLYPLLPVFLTVTLGAPATALGVVEGIADGAANGLRAVAGSVTDRYRKLKPLIIGGYSTSALAKPLLALAFAWPVVLVLRVADRFGKALRGVPRDVMIGEVVTAEQRGRAFGLHRAMDSAGAVAGPGLALIGLAVFGQDHLRRVFLIALVPAAVTLVLLSRLPSVEKAPPAEDAEGGGALPWRGPYGRFVLALGLFGLGNSSDAFLLLRAGDLGLSLTSVICAYALFNAVDAALSYAAGSASDRLGRLTVYRAGLAVFALVYLGFAVTDSPVVVWPLMAVYGAYKALTEGVSRALVLDVVHPDVRGRAIGVMQTVSGLTVLVAGITAGVLYDHVGHAAPFLVGAVMAGAGFVVLPSRRAIRRAAGVGQGLR